LAKPSGLKVPVESIDGAIKFLNQVESPNRKHFYGYTDNQSIGQRRTAMGCVSRLALGWKPGDVASGVEGFVAEGGVPKWDANGSLVDLYYWYYGSLAAFQQGGGVWEKWNAALAEALVNNQEHGRDEDGSWMPVGSHSEYWGRVGQTALAALCLEVYYRYPRLYQDAHGPAEAKK